jgi:uncharacterized membrane protein
MRLIRLLKNDLSREVASWHQQGIINESQAEQICAEYGIDYHHQPSRSYGYYLLVGLGYLFLGLSILVVVGANWQDMPREARMIGLIALTLFTNLAGVYRYAQQRQGEAVVLLLLGSIFYGASIMLIAQIYHLGEHYPDGILWWSLGVLPMAVLTQSFMLTLLTMILSFIWFFVETSLHFFPFMFPVFLLLNAWYLWRVRQSMLLFLSLVTGVGLMGAYVVAWFDGESYRFAHGAEMVVFVWGYFVVLHGLAKWLSAHTLHVLKDYGALLSLWVLRFTLLTLFVMSFAGAWKDLLRTSWETPLATMIMLVTLCAGGIAGAYAAKADIRSILIMSVVLTGIIGLAMAQGDSSTAELFQLLDNIALVVVGIWLVVRGIRAGISQYFYAGVATIMLTGLLRYIDLIGDYIGAAILFIIFALILLSAARYWKSHYTGEGAS